MRVFLGVSNCSECHMSSQDPPSIPHSRCPEVLRSVFSLRAQVSYNVCACWEGSQVPRSWCKPPSPTLCRQLRAPFTKALLHLLWILLCRALPWKTQTSLTHQVSGFPQSRTLRGHVGWLDKREDPDITRPSDHCLTVLPSSSCPLHRHVESK